MKLSELIALVGDDDVKIQPLDLDLKEVRIAGSVGKMTFNTDPQHVYDSLSGSPEWQGLVVWLPRTKVKQVIEERS